MAGFAYWQFKTFKDFTSQTKDRPEGYYNPDGTVQTLKIKALSRTYVMYAQGHIIRNQLNKETGGFVAVI